MIHWQLLNARLTVFVAPNTVVPVTLWRDLVGEEPENSAQQRATLTRVETGPFADSTLRLQTQPMRIDWIQEPEGLGPEVSLPQLLGPFPAAAEALLKLGRRWASSGLFPSAQRLALGFVLVSPTPNREEGYRALEQFIDGVPNTPDAVDFQYQVNRPRSSGAGIEGIQVNRLSKWSVGAYQFLAVAPGPRPVLLPTPLDHHLRLELDISTSADFQGVISAESAEAVIDDLFRAANEIGERGNHF